MKWQPYQFNCPQCNKVFNSHRKDAKYCSRACNSASRKQSPILKNCKWCGKEFDARERNHNRELSRMLKQEHCSRKCSSQARATWYNQEKHHAWKGGVFDDSGYKRVNIYLGEGKRYMPGEHRIIMEQVTGEKLGELVVHHKDRNRSNNEVANLQIMTRSEHSKHHYEEVHYFVAKKV